MKKILAIIIMLISVPALAQINYDTLYKAGFNNLSEPEKAEMIKQVADKMAEKKNIITTANEDKVERWVKIGTNIGQGLAGAAKEVGVAVNEFSNTPVGQLTMALIVWHMVGNVIVHIIGGVLVWVVGFIAIRSLIKKMFPDNIVYSTTQKNIFGNYAIERVVRNNDMSRGTFTWISIVYVVIIMTGLVTIFTF